MLIGALFHSAALSDLTLSNFGSYIGIEECILFVVLLFATNKWKKHPIFYIVLSAIVGIVFALCCGMKALSLPYPFSKRV